MNRFKFRVWEIENKKWMFPFQIAINIDGKLICPSYEKLWNEWKIECVIQQFTGLLDKNGKEIYEGDIIKVSELGHNQNAGTGKRRILQTFEKAVVTWQNGSYFYNPIRKVGANIPHQLLYYGYDKEIIGNIYENPEILEKNEKS